jgi:hypothetical protein
MEAERPTRPEMPGMTAAARLARRLGLDHNPLRRRTDRIVTCLAAQLLAAFLVGAPLLAMAAIAWVGHEAATQQRAERAWHRVSAVLPNGSPEPGLFLTGVSPEAWVPARWAAPGGHARSGRILVQAGLAAGTTVPLWVDAAGRPTGPPLSRQAVLARESAAAVTATFLLGVVLLSLGSAGRWALHRRRLAGWEAEWATVGPQWTKRFRSRG